MLLFVDYIFIQTSNRFSVETPKAQPIAEHESSRVQSSADAIAFAPKTMSSFLFIDSYLVL